MNNDTLRLQKVQIKIAKEFKRICDKYNLQYFLIYGSLLGAVRHEGFIPWDDDIDIGMPRKDYDQFVSKYYKELDNSYYMHSRNTDSLFWLPWCKIRKKDTLYIEESTSLMNSSLGINIDIFPFDNSYSNNNLITRFQRKITNVISHSVFYKTGVKINYSNSLKAKLILLILRPFKVKTLNYIQQLIMKANIDTKAEYMANIAGVYSLKKEVFPKSDIFPLKELLFNGVRFKVPANYTAMLETVYGDFMVMPPLDQRKGSHAIKVSF